MTQSHGNNHLPTALGIVAAALTIHQTLQWRHKKTSRIAQLTNLTKLELLPSESSPILMMSPSTSTLTWFQGSPTIAAKQLSKRVAEIMTANPWLASILDTDPDTSKIAAFFPKTLSDSSNFFHVRTNGMPLRRSTSYPDMIRALEPMLCKTSAEALGTGAPLFKVALLPDADTPDERYALVVSANHSLLDGHGFYKITNMLSPNAVVEALSPWRKQFLPDQMLESMGGETSLMAACIPGFLVRFMFGQLWEAIVPQTVAMVFDVSEEWISEQKKRALGGQVPWVSTNDCVVSAFLNCLRPDCAMMAINFRGKIEGCGEDDVGNYEDLLMYMRGDYETPALVRQSVRNPENRLGDGSEYFRRAGLPPTATLSNWEHLCGAKYGAITNWSTFARPLELGDGVGEQELHLPLFDWGKACPACIFGSIVLFQPNVGRIGAMIAGTRELIHAVEESGMVGNTLDIDMFCSKV